MTSVLDAAQPSRTPQRLAAGAAAVALHLGVVWLARGGEAPPATEHAPAPVRATHWVDAPPAPSAAAQAGPAVAEPAPSQPTSARRAAAEPQAPKAARKPKAAPKPKPREKPKPAEKPAPPEPAKEVLDLTSMVLAESGAVTRASAPVAAAAKGAEPSAAATEASSGGSPGGAPGGSSGEKASLGSGSGSGKPDLRRPPRLANNAAWRCPLPQEALQRGLNEADVIVRVEVDSQNRLLGVEPVRDPGYGFFAAARRCAQQKRWLSALDRDGRPVGATQLVRIQFSVD